MEVTATLVVGGPDDDNRVRAEVLRAAATGGPELEFKVDRTGGHDEAERGRADPCQLRHDATVVGLHPGMGDIVSPGIGVAGHDPEGDDLTGNGDLVGARIGEGQEARAARIVLQPQTVQ